MTADRPRPAGAGAAQVVPLGALGEAAEAARLADRLVAEGVGARADGPVVWVRAGQKAEAVALARLFREVDERRSRVAPVPASLWAGPAWRTVSAVLLSLTLVAATVAVLVVALAV